MATLVRSDYSTFEKLKPQTYGNLVARGLIKGCEKTCATALKRIAAQTSTFQKTDPRDGMLAIDDAFFAEMNARVGKDESLV